MKKLLKMFFQPKIRYKENVFYELKDRNGKSKELFKADFVFTFLLKMGWISPNFKQLNYINGVFVKRLKVQNLVTNAGKAGAASRFNGAGSEAEFKYIGLGTGTTAAAATDTTLETEITSGGGGRALGTTSRITGDVTNDTSQVVASFTFTGSFALTESGLFNALSGGVLACRQVHAAVNVVSGDVFQATWQVKAA